VALAVLLVAAAGARLFNLDWDGGDNLHPDEMHIAKDVLINRIGLDWPPDLGNLLDPARSGLNPRSVNPETGEYREFAYGALPLFVTDLAAALVSRLSGENWNAPDRAYLVGRSLSVLFDTATVLVVFALGSRVFGRRVGLLGAAFAALAPMSIQLAHFFTTDSWLTFFVALCLLAAVRAAEEGDGGWFAATGACFGLAMATKGSVFTLAGVLGAAALYAGWRRYRGGEALSRLAGWVVGRLAIGGAAAVAAFALFEPYALVRPGIYLFSINQQARIVSGSFDVPFTRVYVGTAPILYQLEQFVRWGFGPVAGLLALAGVALLVRRFWRERSAGHWILLAWLLGYGLVVAVAEAKFLRYLAPLVPVLAVMAGLAVDGLWRTVASRWGRRPAAALAGLALAGAALWTVAFLNVYAQEHPRLAASRWIYANVPDGSALTAELWDDALPRSLGAGLTPGDRQYEVVAFDSYQDRPPAEAAAELYSLLERVDYVVSSSNRIPDALAQAPWRYPAQLRFLDLLAGGNLGFERAAEFESMPRLGPLRFDDRWADESFVNYDHPRVTIFRKSALVERSGFDALMAPALDRPWFPTRHEPSPSLLLDEPVGELPVVADARWSERLTGNSWAALGGWILLLAALQVAAWPLAALAFRRFADGGWGLSRLLALVVAGWLVWLGASLEVIAFRAVWCWAAVALLAAIGWIAWRRWRRPGGAWAFRPGQRRAAVGAEIVFWGVFGLFLLFRYLNPDGWHPIWGGEKPMEFAHLNATLRSAHFPPYDPWYAEGYVNYYYYGLYLVAFCLKLTGIPSEIGFNLAQPTVIALLASAGYTVAATLGRAIAPRRPSPNAAGALGVLLLVGIGNLTGLGALLDPNRPALFSGDGFEHWVWDGTRAITVGERGYAITEFPFFTALYADLHAHVVALPLTVLAIALGWGLARDGLPPRPWHEPDARAAWAVFAARFLLLALVIGSLFATNAWDVPTYAALGAASLFAAAAGARLAPRLGLALGATALLGLLAYASFLPFHQHYVALFGSLARVQEPTAFGQVVSHLGGLLAIVAVGLVVALLPDRGRVPWPVRSPVLVLAAVLLFSLRVIVGTTDPGLAVLLGAATVAVSAFALAGAAWSAATDRNGAARWPTALIAVGAGLVLAALVAGWVTLGAFLAAALGGAALWLLGRSAAARFVGLLVAAAGGVAAGTELVVVADDLIGSDWYRMNTVFKFYNQVWVLLALAGAALLAQMVEQARPPGAATAVGLLPRRGSMLGFASGAAERPISQQETEAAPGSSAVRAAAAEAARTGWAWTGIAVSAVLIGASLLYPLTATVPRLEQRFAPDLGSGTLNANDWMRYGTVPSLGPDGEEAIGFAEDRAVIDWFNREVPGSPVVAEASIGPYRCNGSRISIGTGLPTIIGWERHEQQQRYLDGLRERVEDVERLYTSPDPAEKAAILRRYDVGYVVVGELERRYPIADNTCAPTGSAAGIAAFEPMVGETLELAYEAGGTRVYRVLPVGGGAGAGAGAASG